MKSPAQHRVIQIELTNACPHICGNCTRFCGHHRKPFHMDWDHFRQAVSSLEEFPHMVGIMGGEPTIHREFDRFVRHYAERIGPPGPLRAGLIPRNDIHIGGHLGREPKRGLWTSLGKYYFKHFELIQDVFEYQCINDHCNPGLHQSLLITRQELGIPDAEWIKKRDACWIQNLWSASITPKGAFFCEVAGALDQLFDGPGGWPIEKGWWQRTPEEFGEQLKWCELCSAPLSVPKVHANQDMDLVSPVMFEKLRALGSPKLRKGKVSVLDTANYDPAQYEAITSYGEEAPYLFPGSKRISESNSSVRPQGIDAIILVRQADAASLQRIAKTAKSFDRVCLALPERLPGMAEFVAKQAGTVKMVEAETEGIQDLGTLLNRAIQDLRPTGWLFLTDSDTSLPENFRSRITYLIYNPGCLYYYRRGWSSSGRGDCGTDLAGEPFFQYSGYLFHGQAKALREKTAGWFPVGASRWNRAFMEQWEEYKRIPLPLLERRGTWQAVARWWNRLTGKKKGAEQQSAAEHTLSSDH